MRLHAVYKYKGILLAEKPMHTNAQERGNSLPELNQIMCRKGIYFALVVVNIYLLDFPPVAKSLAGVGKWVSSGLVPGPPHRSRQGWITVLSMTITITKTMTKSKISNKFQSSVVPYTLNDNDNQQHDTMKTKEILYKVQRFNQYERVGIPPNYNFWSLDQLGIFDASKYQLTSLQIFLIIFRKASVTSSRMLSQ